MSFLFGEHASPTTQEQRDDLKDQASSVATAFGEDLNKLGLSDGVVVYGLDSRTNYASVLASTPAIKSELKKFRAIYIDNHAIDLSVSGLGKQLKGFTPTSTVSQLEVGRIGSYRNRHRTLALRPTTSDAPHIVAQVALSEHDALPDPDSLEEVWNIHQRELNVMNESAADLMTESRRLALHQELELLPAVTANGFIVRWDLDNSTRLAAGPLYGKVRNFLEDSRDVVRHIVQDTPNALFNIGDGQNIIVMLPENLDGADPELIVEFEKEYIAPIVTSLEEALHSLASSDLYSTLDAHVSIGATSGHIERNRDGSFDSPALWKVSSKTKRK